MKFSELKQKARKFYVDRSDIDILKELLTYNDQDIKEMIDEKQSTG
jgi:hypothetical protein